MPQPETFEGFVESLMDGDLDAEGALDTMMSYVEDLSAQRHFRIGEVEYEIGKMGSVDAWRVFDTLKKRLVLANDGGNSGVAGLFVAFLTLDTAFLEREAMEPMFKHVRYKTPEMNKLTPLNYAQDQDAFDDPLDVYVLLLRCLIVFFTGRLKSLIRKLAKASRSSSRSNLAQSLQSSLESSPLDSQPG